MRAFQVIAIAILLTAVAPLAASNATTTVTLDLNLGDAMADYKNCEVTFAAGGNVGDVLDAAVASGCLDSWTAVDYGAFGRFVDCIDNICGQGAAIFVGTFWEINTNGVPAAVGIDQILPANGDVVTFDYEAYAFTP